MRKLVVVVGILLLVASCTPSLVPVPIVTTPKFPEYIEPPVPQALALSKAIPRHDRAWRFFQAGDPRNADVELAAALKLDPGFFPAETMAGYLDLSRKDPKAALGRFDRAVELSNTYTPALVGRGEALVAMDRENDAIAAFGAALAVDPNRTDLQRRIEVLRFRGLERNLAAAREAAKAGRAEDARRAYQSAIESSPESAFLYRELGAVERQAGAADLAISHFRKAVELDASDAGSVAQVGELLEGRGDDAGALDAYNKSLAIEPNDRVETRRDALVAKAELAKLPEEYRAIESAAEVTRGDLAALIGVRLNSTVLAMRSREPIVVTDVRGTWAENWITAVARAGVIEPYANHTFQPRATVRRADLAQAASRVLARLGTADQVRAWQNARAKFTDIAQGHLAYPAASMAVAAGVMSTAPDGSFLPSRLVTGDEAVETIQRLQTMAESAARRDAGR